MMRSSIKTKTVSILRSVCVLLFWIAVWWATALFVDKKVLLPTPADVLRKFADLIFHADFWITVSSTLLRILLGYALGCLLGILAAILLHFSRLADALLSPILSIIRAVPVASFIVLALVWIGRANIPVFIAVLMVLPIVCGNVRCGLEEVDRSLSEVAFIYRFSWEKKFRHLYIPAVFPHLLSGASTSLGLAWKAGVAAEVLCSLSASIGGKIHDSKVYLETDGLFAWTITVIVISMSIESLLLRAKKPGGIHAAIKREVSS